MASDLKAGDLVARTNGSGDLYIVIGFTYRVSRWGNQRLMKLFCSSTGKQVYILERMLTVINSANSEKSS